MTEICLELPDQKRNPRCNIKVTLTLADNATVQPLSYEKARHRGVAFYDKQRMARKLEPITCPRDFDGWSTPLPSWIG